MSLALIGSFGALDWGVVAGVLILTTAVGWIAGRRGSIREYFLGGRRLPWWAVSASIVATESAR
jgi:Na+/proline symporter